MSENCRSAAAASHSASEVMYEVHVPLVTIAYEYAMGGEGGARGGAERSRQMQRYVVEHVPPEPVSKKSWALEMAQPGATELMGRVMKPEL